MFYTSRKGYDEQQEQGPDKPHKVTHLASVSRRDFEARGWHSGTAHRRRLGRPRAPPGREAHEPFQVSRLGFFSRLHDR
jgi:hypothetical protein